MGEFAFFSGWWNLISIGLTSWSQWQWKHGWTTKGHHKILGETAKGILSVSQLPLSLFKSCQVSSKGLVENKIPTRHRRQTTRRFSKHCNKLARLKQNIPDGRSLKNIYTSLLAKSSSYPLHYNADFSSVSFSEAKLGKFLKHFDSIWRTSKAMC